MPPLKYESMNEAFDAFNPILEDYGLWFHNLLEHLFYPNEIEGDCKFSPPTSFAQWIVLANQEKKVRPEIIDRLNTLNGDLLSEVSVLCEVAKATGEQPDYKKYKNFVTLYEEFILNVRRLEKGYLAEESGFDSFTGLRSKSMLVKDVSREMERLARQGKSFCLALAKIDHFDGIVDSATGDEADGYIRLLAGLIKISIRSFDDAYYMEDGVFALCLKQADITGGFSALERLRKELEQQHISVQLYDNGAKALSMSCCIAEPIVGDDLDELMANLSKDLAESDMESTDTVLKYREMSALERFVQET